MSASLASHLSIGKGEERSAFSRGRHARNRVVFINSRRGCGAEGETLGIRTSLTWSYARAQPGASPAKTDGALQAPPADENHPISGRSPRDLRASGIGRAWGESPDPRLIARALLQALERGGLESPSRLSLRVRESLGWRLSRSLLRRPSALEHLSSHSPSLLVALHNPGRKALGLCA